MASSMGAMMNVKRTNGFAQKTAAYTQKTVVSVENFIPETLILEEVSAPAAIPMRSL